MKVSGRTVLKLALKGIGYPGIDVQDVDMDLTELFAFAKMAQVECPVASTLFINGLVPLKLQIEDCALRALKFERDLRLLDDMLKDFGPVVLLKGGAWRFTLYPDPSLRQSVDIDILVEPKRWKEAQKFLISRGFKRESPGDLRSRLNYEVTFRHPHLNYLIELHKGLTDSFRYKLPVNELFEEAYFFKGFENLKATPMKWNIIQSCVHFAQRGFKQPLKHLIDLMIMTKDASAKEDALEIAKAAGITRLVRFSYRLTEVALMEDPPLWYKIAYDGGPYVLNLPMETRVAVMAMSPILWDNGLDIWRFVSTYSAIRLAGLLIKNRTDSDL